MKYLHALLILSVLLLLNACTKLGPDFIKPVDHKLPRFWDTNSTQSDKIVEEWWKLFKDKTLNTLVDNIVQQNLDLRAAGLRILQARAALGISQGLKYPQVQTLSGSLAGTRNNGNSIISTGVNFDLSWEIDVWGKYARGIESSEATLYASIASYDDILVSIISEVARNYINYRTAQERYMFAQRNIAIQERVTKITEIQFNAGNVSELDMQQAKSQLYSTMSTLPTFKFSMVKSRNALATLLNILPEEMQAILHIEQTSLKNMQVQQYDYQSNSLIPTLILDENFTVSADLVSRRPDIQIAELQARAQSARIGSAEAELYPHFSLFGSIGYSSHNILGHSISTGDTIGISAGPSFSWNIFNYGRIKDQVRIQDAKFQESLANYNKKVLLAVQEVSNSLNGYKLTKEQLELNSLATEATQRAYNISITQYENGLTSYQRLLTSVEKLTRNEDYYALIKGNISLQAIALYKALGGGWQIGRDKEYLHAEDVVQMHNRTQWGEYLDADKISLVKEEKR